MPDPIICLNEDPTQDPWSRLTVASPERSLAAVLADVREAAMRADLIVIIGTDPGRSPHLATIVAEARRHEAIVAIEADARGLDHDVLVGAGIEVVIVPIHGDQETHDRLVGDGSLSATRRLTSHAHRALLAERARHRAPLPASTQMRVRARIGLTTASSMIDSIRAVRDPARFILDGGVPGSTPDNRAPAIGAAWEELASTPHGAKLPAEIVLVDADCAPDATPGAARLLDEGLLSARLQGGWLPGLAGGVLTSDADPDRVRLLHALGMPARDQPFSPPHDLPLVGRVHVVVPYLGDAILACSTLPRLCRALADRGVDASLHSVWNAPYNVHAAFGDADAALPTDAPLHERRRAAAQLLGERFLRSLDLSSADVIVAPGWRAAHALWSHPTRRADAQLIVIDLHLEDGLDLWGDGDVTARRKAAPSPSWWPGPQLRVVSCFPGFAGTYLRAGVPMSAMRWLPYPIARDALPAATRTGDAPWLAAGNQRRDDRLLEVLAARLAGPRPLHVLAARCPPMPAPHRHLGTTSPSGLAHAVASARALILPVLPSAHDAAGITLAAMAMATGTPVIGSRAWGLVDHIPVAAGRLAPMDVDAFLEGLHALEDPEQHAEAASAAMAAGAMGDVSAWADALATGLWPRWPLRP